jgi:hypothetical protein
MSLAEKRYALDRQYVLISKKDLVLPEWIEHSTSPLPTARPQLPNNVKS